MGLEICKRLLYLIFSLKQNMEQSKCLCLGLLALVIPTLRTTVLANPKSTRTQSTRAIVKPTKLYLPCQKLWSSSRALSSRTEGSGFDPRPIQCQMEVVSNPCQDRILHPILVQYRKIRKYRQPNGSHKKSFIYQFFLLSLNIYYI